MALPNPSMSFSPFAILTAEEMNNLVENIEALSAGTGLADSAVTTAKINNLAVTTAKLANTSVTSSKIDFTTFPTNTNWDSGWINVTFQNSYANQSSSTVSYRKIGGVVYLRGESGKAVMDSNTMFTLPVGFRPPILAIYTVPGTSANYAKFVVNTDGTCNQNSLTGGTYVGLDGVSFPAA